MSEIGFLYVLANSSMPGLIKVGKTTRSPTERATELSGVTGIATPFIVVYEQLFQDCHSAESFVHAYLANKSYRVALNREFFNAPTSVIIKAIGLAPGQIDGDLAASTLLESTDELITSNAGDELNDLKLAGPVQAEPWAALLEEADMHYWGHGDYIQDRAESLRLLRQAATLGCTEAYGIIGKRYERGEGTPKNPAKALEFYKEGAKRGRPSCYLKMGLLFSYENNDANADKCFSLFMKNFPTGTLSKAVVSDSEAADVEIECLHIVMERCDTDAWDRHSVINEFIVSHRKAILEAAQRMIDLWVNEGDASTMVEEYMTAREYIKSL